MNPQEYLEELQSAYRFFPYLLKMQQERMMLPIGKTYSQLMTEYFGRDLGLPVTYDQYEEWENDPAYSWVVQNYQVLRVSLSKQFVQQLDKATQIAVGELRSADFNGSAIPVENAERLSISF